MICGLNLKTFFTKSLFINKKIKIKIIGSKYFWNIAYPDEKEVQIIIIKKISSIFFLKKQKHKNIPLNAIIKNNKLFPITILEIL